MSRTVPMRSARITSHGAVRLSPDILGPSEVDYLFVKVDGNLLKFTVFPSKGFKQKKTYVSNKRASRSVMVNVGSELGKGSVSLTDARGEYAVSGTNGNYQIQLRRRHGKEK